MNALQAFAERVAGYSIDWEATAAWVQAFGTLFALFVTIEVSRREQKQKRAALRRTVLTYARTIHEAIMVASLYGPDEAPPVADVDLDSAGLELKLRSLINAVERLPLDQLEDDQALDAVLRLIGATETFMQNPLGLSPTLQQGLAAANQESTPQRARQRVAEQLARLESALGRRCSLSSILSVQAERD